MTSISAVQARTTELQGMINSITPGRSEESKNQTAATSAFNSVLAQALSSQGTGGSQVADDGSLLVGGLPLSQFADAQVTPGSGMQALQLGMKYIGVPYVWGGSSPDGFDCSGLMQYVMKQMGVSLPRVAADQATVGTEVPSIDQAQPGDLVVTNNGGHVGMYVGGGKMLQAPQPGESVEISDISGEIYTIRRVLPTGSVLGSGAASSLTGSAAVDEAALGRALLQSLAASGQSSSAYGSGSSLSLQSMLGMAGSL